MIIVFSYCYENENKRIEYEVHEDDKLINLVDKIKIDYHIDNNIDIKMISYGRRIDMNKTMNKNGFSDRQNIMIVTFKKPENMTSNSTKTLNLDEIVRMIPFILTVIKDTPILMEIYLHNHETLYSFILNDLTFRDIIETYISKRKNKENNIEIPQVDVPDEYINEYHMSEQMHFPDGTLMSPIDTSNILNLTNMGFGISRDEIVRIYMANGMDLMRTSNAILDGNV